MTDQDDTKAQPTLPGMEEEALYGGEIGPLERAVQLQIEALQRMGIIEEHHVGQCVLARAAARDIDRSTGKGAPSGRAQLLRVMNEILATLPAPETQSKDQLDELNKLLAQAEAEEAERRAIAARSKKPEPKQ